MRQEVSFDQSNLAPTYNGRFFYIDPPMQEVAPESRESVQAQPVSFEVAEAEMALAGSAVAVEAEVACRQVDVYANPKNVRPLMRSSAAEASFAEKLVPTPAQTAGRSMSRADRVQARQATMETPQTLASLSPEIVAHLSDNVRSNFDKLSAVTQRAFVNEALDELGVQRYARTVAPVVRPPLHKRLLQGTTNVLNKMLIVKDRAVESVKNYVHEMSESAVNNKWLRWTARTAILATTVIAGLAVYKGWSPRHETAEHYQALMPNGGGTGTQTANHATTLGLGENTADRGSLRQTIADLTPAHAPAVEAPQPITLSLSHEGDSILRVAREYLQAHGYPADDKSLNTVKMAVYQSNGITDATSRHMNIGAQFTVPPEVLTKLRAA